MIEKEDIETDLNIGKAIFENVPHSLRPYWSGLILSTFNNHIKYIPNPVKELHSIVDHESRWAEAHAQFSEIRRFLLDHKHFQPDSFLVLAEKVAKVTYNASGRPAPFDADSGWYIPSLAMNTARSFNDIRLIDEVRAIILWFN